MSIELVNTLGEGTESQELQKTNDSFFEEDTDSQNFTYEQKLGLIETLLFTSGVAISLDVLTVTTGIDDEELLKILDDIASAMLVDSRGLELVKVAGKYQLRTKPMFAPYVLKLRAGKPKKLSKQALETLAVIAYKQQITKSEIEKIRGVDCTPTIKTLLERELIKIFGYQNIPGQPAIYVTTDKFLELFGLNGLHELPTLRDVGILENEPGEDSSEVMTVINSLENEPINENLDEAV
jgi:segregation and condensation protein B